MRRLLATATLLPILWASGTHPAPGQVVRVADDVILLTKGATRQEQMRTHQHLGVPGAESRLPPGPGSGVPALGEPSVVRPMPGVLSGAAAQPGERYGGAEQPRILPPPRQAGQPIPLYGPLELPAAQDEGPPDGLTLDAAIDRLVHANYDLLTKFQEIPKAQADILSAGLRLNPVLFASADNVPYGNYSRQRPGANSYEATLIQPIDVNQKRKDRVRVAQQAKRVLEAQYQDAVRLQIDNLYTAYVDVLEARETMRAARAGVAGLAEVVKVTRDLVQRGFRPRTDVDRALIQQANAEVALQAAQTALGQARRNLATLLAVSAQQADCLEVRGTIRDRSAPLPCLEELIRIALESRPDLAAFRLGVQRAEAAVQLARAERFEDVFLFYNPYTYTNNSPMGRQDAASWGAGVLLPLPVFNRNQGNIARARINVAQTQIELEGLERQIANEVQRAAAEAADSRAALGRYEQDILPAARRLRDEEFRLFLKGQEGATVYLAAQREYNEVVRQYLQALVRHRRNLLRLNTAVGERVVP
jgi:cobalt-zinc-cadmium efflux system outer membrane protein